MGNVSKVVGVGVGVGMDSREHSKEMICWFHCACIETIRKQISMRWWVFFFSSLVM